jgi:hypothetical protein
VSPPLFCSYFATHPPAANLKKTKIVLDFTPSLPHLSRAMNAQALDLFNLALAMSVLAREDSLEKLARMEEPFGLSPDKPWPNFNRERPHDWYINPNGLTVRFPSDSEPWDDGLDDDEIEEERIRIENGPQDEPDLSAPEPREDDDEWQEEPDPRDLEYWTRMEEYKKEMRENR